MPQLIRPILLSSQTHGVEILPADAACQSCPTPCRPVTPPPANAVAAELSLSAGLLNRLALVLFGLPLLLLGSLIAALDGIANQPLVPLAVFGGGVAALTLGARLAKGFVPQVMNALQQSGCRIDHFSER